MTSFLETTLYIKWSPTDLPPSSGDLFAAGATGHSIHPLALLAEAYAPAPTCPRLGLFHGPLLLGRFLASGRVWAAHHADVPFHGLCYTCGTPHPCVVARPGALVAKVHVRPGTAVAPGPDASANRGPGPRPSGQFPSQASRYHTGRGGREVPREAWIYAYRSPPAPEWYGVFGVGRGVWGDREGWLLVAVMAHGGEAVRDPAALPTAAKMRILELYAELHARGVIHVSAAPKHWVWDGVSAPSLRLIDFGASRVLDGDVPDELRGAGCVLDEEGFAREAAAEISGVRSALGFTELV